jgi:RNA polymerase sigma-54 factor
MKQALQLRVGQHLSMTPQVQQAIRLLQLSTLELQQEIQEALESNLMLEAAEEAERLEERSAEEREEREERITSSDGENERDLDIEKNTLPDELPVDSAWEDVYDSATLPPGSSSRRDDEGIDFLALNSAAETLHGHLLWQLNLTPFGDTDRAIAETIIDAVNEDGYLTQTLEEIREALGAEVDLPEITAVLHRIQRFDPAGVAARDLGECLWLQLQQLPEETPWRAQAMELTGKHFDLLARQEQAQMKRRLKVDDEGLSRITQLVRSLNPRPGSGVASMVPEYVVPDVFVFRKGGTWRVELNPETTPRLRINPDYAALIRRADASQDNQCLKNHMQEARWFIKSLASRNETLLRVASKIVEFQRPFFDYGEEAMKPLVLRDVADALGMHESTVSRVTTQKYMHTPRGTYEFKYFFSSHVSTAGGGECSATAIRALIKKLVASESPEKPLSDNKIAEILTEQGINVARRTVAKYRESMAIAPSSERKRLL